MRTFTGQPCLHTLTHREYGCFRKRSNQRLRCESFFQREGLVRNGWKGGTARGVECGVWKQLGFWLSLSRTSFISRNRPSALVVGDDEGTCVGCGQTFQGRPPTDPAILVPSLVRSGGGSTVGLNDKVRGGSRTHCWYNSEGAVTLRGNTDMEGTMVGTRRYLRSDHQCAGQKPCAPLLQRAPRSRIVLRTESVSVVDGCWHGLARGVVGERPMDTWSLTAIAMTLSGYRGQDRSPWHRKRASMLRERGKVPQF